MTFQILMACMHQKDMQIFRNSNIQCDVLAINQCDHDGVEEQSVPARQQMKCTTQRGLSRSRNMAIDHAWADVCLIADDDERFESDVADRILNAYQNYPDADVIIFQVADASSFGSGIKGDDKVYSDQPHRCGLLDILHFASWQISFRKSRVKEKGICFDEKMGSGTGHGANEENKFLADCLRSGLLIQYVPVLIARMEKTTESQWFHGFDEQFFVNRGWSTRRFLGIWLSVPYAFYYAIRKRLIYQRDVSPWRALVCMLRGIFFVKY